jgi:hypothetical protein
VRNERNERNSAGDGVADGSVLQQHDGERNAPTSDVADVAHVADVADEQGRLPGVDHQDPRRFAR